MVFSLFLFFLYLCAVIYTIEFQKRGLPHAHILLFLHHDSKYPSGEDIDKIISAEIPNEDTDKDLYEVVKTFMIHGPCGPLNKNSPCMVNGKCSKHYPKRFLEVTSVDKDGYPLYRRRDNGRVMEKNGVNIDNRYVVPHNRFLLVKYNAHINVEWCNQHRSIKYLFKYVNKGHDRVTAAFYEESRNPNKHDCEDEISMYYDCRYISPCEAVWRMFAYDIHYREPPVERLSFHLPNEQVVLFGDDDPIDAVMERSRVHKSKFMAWMEANKKYPEAKELTYAQFPSKFVWKQNIFEWMPRKQGFAVGRVFYVPPGSGEQYYQRILLNIVKGPESYEDIRTVNGVLYPTFKEAYYILGLLEDDK